MGCCGSKDSLNKYPNLKKASLMTRTAANNQRICQREMSKLSTKAQQMDVINNPQVSDDLKQVLSEPYSSVDKITDNIYLTSSGGLTAENIEALKITCIINATYEAPNFRIKGIECIRVPVDDTINDDMSPYLDEVADKLNEVTKKNGGAIVHCVAGVSRSSTLVLAYLIKYRNMTLKEAFVSVNTCRSVAQPNKAFFRQLIAYEKKTLGKNSVRMIETEFKGVKVVTPDFYQRDYPLLFMREVLEAQTSRHKRDHIIDELAKSIA